MSFKSLVFVCALAAAASSSVTQLEPYHGIPAGWSIVKAADPTSLIQLTIAVKQRNLKQLEATLLKVSDPKDAANFGKHLSLDEVDRLVAPSTESVARVNDWLDTAGNNTRQANGNSDFITATMTIRDAERLLGVTYSVFEHTSKHQVTRTNQAYSVPLSLADDIDFVGPTLRFPGNLPAPGKSLKSHSGATAITPDVLRKLYSVGDAKAAAGTKNIIACASFLGQFYSATDLQSFFDKFDSSLSGVSPSVVGPNTPTKPGVEAMLDIEYIMAMGKGVQAQFWSTAGEQPHNPENEPFLLWLSAVSNTSDATVPRTFSVSYGDNEPGVNLAYATRVNAEFQKAGTK
jgi:tripeptidyl-peptidase-1